MQGGWKFLVRWRAALAALTMVFCAPAPAVAQDNLEAAVKATFLYRFGSFVEWPETAFVSPDAPIVICVTGGGFADVVAQAAGDERIAGRAIVVRTVGIVSSGSGCHILYATGRGGQTVTESLRAVRGEPVLTVTDSQYGNARGAVHFVVVSDRVRFHIDRDAAAENHLTLNSRLLSIALSVRERGAS